MSNHPYASWRFLITQLDSEDQSAIANGIRHYAERLVHLYMRIANIFLFGSLLHALEISGITDILPT